MSVLSDTGAYGNHASGVLHHACDESLAVYRCPNKQVDGRAVYTNTVPAGAFRGYGLSQTVFAVESAIDALARRLGIDPFEFRRRNMVRSGDRLTSAHDHPDDVEWGSYGLDQCLDLVEAALEGGDKAPPGPEWRVGAGMALCMIHTSPPGGHHAHSVIVPAAEGGFQLTVGTAEFGNGTSTVHAQFAAEILGVLPEAIRLAQSDTDGGGYDTGAYGSTGTVVAGTATLRAAAALRAQLDRLAAQTGIAATDLPGLLAAAREQVTLRGEASFDGRRRSLAFNVQGFRVAVNPRTGELRILQSVHAADAGRVVNLRQCRGQVEGGVAQALGAAMFEEVVIEEGRVVNGTFRNYHLPSLADLPRTEVLFADTYDQFGPLGAKSMSESPLQPGGAGARQRHRRRDRGAPACHPVQAGPDLAGAGRGRTPGLGMSVTIEALNQASAEEFVRGLEGVFEHAPWVAERAAAARPFATVDALHAAMLRVVREAARPELLAFLGGHPELAAAKLPGDLTAESRTEQTGLGMAGTAGAAALPALNGAYRERFGFPFIICVARQTAANVLRHLQRRLAHTPGEELQTTLDEIGHITRLRLAARVTGPGATAASGRLSCHALDVSAGQPASGLQVALLQEDRVVAERTTDGDGRVGGDLLPPGPLREGHYELRFQAGAYFAARGTPTFYDTIPVRIVVASAEGHYHVPLLLAPFGYSTYRGS